jgi:hypothetical protein
MRIVTEISLVSLPGAEPEPEPAPAQRRIQIAPSADGRPAVTFVSWLSPAEDDDGSS